mmetsp:Transcript_43613/g.102832  ORF Transcript_43613/g.102832 Transcript_43613/m.102832 type:complete len:229 (-) Transcript_43613:418-1104(-)
MRTWILKSSSSVSTGMPGFARQTTSSSKALYRSWSSCWFSLMSSCWCTSEKISVHSFGICFHTCTVSIGTALPKGSCLHWKRLLEPILQVLYSGATSLEKCACKIGFPGSVCRKITMEELLMSTATSSSHSSLSSTGRSCCQSKWTSTVMLALSWLASRPRIRSEAQATTFSADSPFKKLPSSSLTGSRHTVAMFSSCAFVQGQATRALPSNVKLNGLFHDVCVRFTK